MKKKLLKIGILILLTRFPLFAQMAVFDASNWLTAIDTLYSQYDMVMNSVTQIQNQYRAIQQAIENAKGIDWENIKFDGDFDIRDDIRNAGKTVNSLLNQANTIRNSINTKVINGNGFSYSLADLCGAGDEGKNFASCVTDVYGYMKDTMKAAANAAVSELSEEQKKSIYAKYGISPQNYFFVAQSSKYVRDKAKDCIAKVTEEARKLQRESSVAVTKTVIGAALEAKTADGTIPEGAMMEGQLVAEQKMIESLQLLNESVDDTAAIVAQKTLLDEAEKEAEAAENLQEDRSAEIFNNNVPGNFAAGKVKAR